ncbi:DHHA1 domain-containing protein [Cytobacillus sp. FJAT-54145]|uniref:DHHA1 domain-containing protein n=1 Tax=Cytobacillus spartinae TaxID=3299023 RepID=A0ABW6K9V9_9BACI
MKDRLYYFDPYIKTFSAKVVKQGQDPTGDHFVVLSETAFYPTGGGQPHDIGKINQHDVINVEEVDGEVRHYTANPIPEDTNEITGEINWQRRFDHMQQHAGQHILSAAFVELYGFETVSFHLGKDYLTIDLDVDDIKEEILVQVESLANQIILENRPIETRWISKEEVTQYPLRKKPTVDENIRLVIIPEFDYNGCGGTHPNSTGEVQAIKILNWERQRKKIRVSFVCGNRVIHQLHQKNLVLTKLSQLLNAPESEMENALSRVLETKKELEKSLEEAQDNIMSHKVQVLIEQPMMFNEQLIIKDVLNDYSLQQLQKMARMVISRAKSANVFLVSKTMNKIQFVFSRGTASNLNMKQLAAELLQVIDGKGGGSESQAQGGGETNLSAEEFLSLTLEKLKG